MASPHGQQQDSGLIGISVIKFDEKQFRAVVAKFIDLSKKERINIAHTKSQLKYLAHYLNKIKTKTVVIEHSYIDPNLHDDHWAYWTDDTSTSQYRWVRMHFFSVDLGCRNSGNLRKDLKIKNRDELHELLRNEEIKSDNYNGNIVVVRGSRDFIGPTFLKEPKAGYTEKTQMNILATREYQFSLLGKKLKIRSLGFIEQNLAVSECATCAVWSVLQKTSVEYGHQSLSPGTITKSAFGLRKAQARALHHKGMTIEEIRNVFEGIPQLNTMVVEMDLIGDEPEKRLYRGFCKILPVLKSGIPVILSLKSKRKNRNRKHDYHAICLTGYTSGGDNGYLAEGKVVGELKTDVDKMVGLIAHDDNIGPFVEYKIQKDGCIKAPEKRFGKGNEWVIENAICVMHSTIKTYIQEDIDKVVTEAGFIELIGLNSKLSFSIYKSNDYKAEFMEKLNGNTHSCKHAKFMEKLNEKMGKLNENRDSKKLTPSIMDALDVLSRNLPRYIYVVHIVGVLDMDIIFSLANPWGMKIIGIAAT